MNISLDSQSLFNAVELSIYQEEDGRFHIANDTALYSLFTIINIVKAVSKDPIHDLFLLDKNGRSLVAHNRFLEQALSSLISVRELCNSNYACEHLDVFIEAYQVAVAPYIHPDDEYVFWRAQPNQKFEILANDNGLIQGSKSAAALKNSLVYEISLRTDQAKFKTAQYERSRKAKRQYERATKLVNSLKRTFSKLLVLRIDFCWKNEPTSTIDEIKVHFSRFMKRFHHDKNLPNIVGYIWKLEFGRKKGYHYHCIFFMDGNRFKSDSHYASTIGKYWNKLTLNKGFFYNCHLDKIKYRHLAIGLARHNDQVFFTNLDQVLLYICKQDQFIIDKHLQSGEIRVFQTSQPPTKATNLGRPRKLEHIHELAPPISRPSKALFRSQIKRPFLSGAQHEF
ncbi:hypothetical protein [Acinetobacter johnsonii]|uniref:hypothetical protein n=1 Tax=Acinetobacter johnsonii TaxID=40214 RepID=UPI003016E07F